MRPNWGAGWQLLVGILWDTMEESAPSVIIHQPGGLVHTGSVQDGTHARSSCSYTGKNMKAEWSNKCQRENSGITAASNDWTYFNGLTDFPLNRKKKKKYKEKKEKNSWIISHYFTQETETRIWQKESNVWIFYSIKSVQLSVYKTSEENLTEIEVLSQDTIEMQQRNIQYILKRAVMMIFVGDVTKKKSIFFLPQIQLCFKYVRFWDQVMQVVKVMHVSADTRPRFCYR